MQEILNIVEPEKSLPPTSNRQWDSLVREHQAWVRRLVMARVGSGPEVDDVAQEVLLAVREHPSQTGDPDSIRAWLYGVTVRRIADCFRRQYANEKKLQQYAAQGTQNNEERYVGQWLCDAELQSRLQSAIDRLDAEDQALFLHKYRDDWSYEQLANELGVDPRHVEYRLVKIKKQLRRLLQSRDQGSNP